MGVMETHRIQSQALASPRMALIQQIFADPCVEIRVNLPHPPNLRGNSS
jgi:hypothetical protein